MIESGPMTRDQIIAKLRETAPALRAEGVTKLAIFGSRSRGDASPDSDLDVLIEVDPAAPFSGSICPASGLLWSRPRVCRRR